MRARQLQLWLPYGPLKKPSSLLIRSINKPVLFHLLRLGLRLALFVPLAPITPAMAPAA